MDKELFLSLHAQGLPDMDIAERLLGNREKNSGQQVSRLRKSYGLPPNKAKTGPKPDTSLDAEITRLYTEELLTCEKIAEKVSRGVPFVYDRLKKLNVYEGGHSRGRYGKTNQPPSNLDEVWTASIKSHHNKLPGRIVTQGSAHRVAEHYGVSPQVATNWLKGAGLLKERLPEIDTWKGLYEAGMSCEAIAQRVGANYATVSKHLKLHGVEVRNGYSYEEQALREWVESLGVQVISNSRSIIPPKEIDIYCPDQKVAIEYNGEFWHSGDDKRAFHKTMMCQEKDIRLIHVWRHLWINPAKRPIYENMIKHALGLTEHKIGARQTRIEKRPAVAMKKFFEDNNIQGYRQAKWAYVLVDKKTDLDLMCYTTGHAYFGKGLYDLEIARGACRLGWSVSGGATKLWKAVIEDNPEVNSIVYYVDLNHYNGSSVSVLPGAKLIKKGEPSLWNWWPKLGVMKNREPKRHKEIMEAYKTGDAVPVWNAGTAVYLWERHTMC